MLTNILSTIGETFGLHHMQKVTQELQRKFLRRDGGSSTVMINGKEFLVENWSEGGLLLAANSNHAFQRGDELDMLIKFSLPYNTINIRHEGQIIRTAKEGGIAMQFKEMPQEVKRQFDRVVDSIIAEGFVLSLAN